jgi:probable F420-dependent oxidoreductase
VDLGRIGVWTGDLNRHPADEVPEAVAEIEALGFRTLWVSEAPKGREAMAHAALLLSATERLIVAIGVASIWARDATAMALGQRTLAEAWPSRFLLGIGVSHDPLVRLRGHDYRRPLEAMGCYLDAMDATLSGDVPPPPEPPPRVLGALGPKMLELARDRANGAHPFFVPPEHTALARDILGPARLLIPQQAVILTSPEDEDAWERARTQVRFRLSLPNYRRNLERLGFGEDDFADGGSARMIERLIVIGGEEAVASRLQEHVEAGADQVAVQVLVEPGRLPLPEWRRLATLL